MATPKTLIILLLLLGVISACPDGGCRQLFFRADFTFGNRRLIKHVIESIDVRDFDLCELHCYHQPNCVSINFVFPERNGLHKCELNNATHLSHGWDFKNIDGYIYKGTESACDKGPCKNNGTCQSGYTDKGYRCLCPPQWTSDHCERDVNECQSRQTNLCDKDAICNNINGSYSCHCEQGFVGDGFTCTSIIPHPSAWFPFNGTYNTSEIDNRTTSGSKHGKVYLSLGPDGTQNGSYFFRGSPDDSIHFTGNNSELDIAVSITILFWLYTYDNDPDTTFLQYKGMKLVAYHKKLTLTLPGESATPNGILAEKGWKFVGVSYNKATAEAKLWIDGKIVKSVKAKVNFSSQLLTLGGDNFTGKITQLMMFNLTLTGEQIQGIKRRMRLPAMIFNSTIISSNSFYRAELASFLATVVGQIKSEWKMCHNTHVDGWKPQTFHSNCNKRNHTVTIIERKPYIFGGYTDIPWESKDEARNTLKAFIFSLNNSEGLPPFKCLAQNERSTIFDGSSYGPTFGQSATYFTTGDKLDGVPAMARIDTPYSVPIEVKDEKAVLAGESETFYPDSYEVFYLA